MRRMAFEYRGRGTDKTRLPAKRHRSIGQRAKGKTSHFQRTSIFMSLTSNGVFSQALKQSNQLLLAANVVLLIAALVIAVTGIKTFYEQVRGPQIIDPAAFSQLDIAPDSFKSRYVTLTGTEIIDTGAGEITVRKKRGIERSRSETAHYYALATNGKFLLVRGAVAAHDTPQVSGWLSEPKTVDASTLSQLNAGPAKGKLFTHVVLDETDDGTFTWGVALATVAACALAIWNITKALARNKDAAKFPAIARAPATVRKNVSAFVTTVDRDLSAAVKGIGDLRIGTMFALRKHYTRVDLIAFNDLAWIYPQVTKKKMLYVIPAGSDHAVRAFTAAGQSYELPAGSNAEKAAALFEQLTERAPAAVSGYSADIETLWKKNRNGFLGIVANRRAQLAAGDGPATAA
jgi:hypothetical protein